MTQMQLAYHVAKTQLGVKEIVGKQHNPKVVEYHQSCTLQATADEVPWCAAFVNWCYLISGILLNPGSMNQLMYKKYQSEDVDTFFRSAVKVAQQMGGFRVDNIIDRKLTETMVKLPTRSALARSFAIFSMETKSPKQGDIVVFARKGGASGHVAFVEEVGPINIKCLGGNQSNSVCISNYPRFRVINYRTDG